MNPIRTLSALSAAAVLAGCAAAPPGDNGMVAVKSPYSATETLSRLEAQVRQRNLAVVARVDHAAGAQRVAQTLRPTEVMIFGNPQAGTPLMQCAQGVGIDLPMKALVWVDAQQQVWLGYNDPVWLVRRHGGADCPAAENVRKALAAIAGAAVAR
ncbi:MAG: DUF302 domain-containing protein [Burkholderiales bacterium]|nr:DUF302 domain-containing protein [Burkholderiales bacterium]